MTQEKDKEKEKKNKLVPLANSSSPVSIIPGITFGNVTGVSTMSLVTRGPLPNESKQKVKLKSTAPISAALKPKRGRLMRKKKVL